MDLFDMRVAIRMSMVSRRNAAIAAALSSLLVASCAGRRPAQPIEPPTVRSATLNELVERVRAASIPTSWTARAELRLEDLRRRSDRRVGVRIAARKPDRLRIQGNKPLLPTIFVLVANSDGLWLDVPSKRTTYTLAADAEPDLVSVPAGLLTLRSTDFLRAVIPDAPADDERWIVQTEPLTYVLAALVERDGQLFQRREFRFDRFDLQLSGQRLFADDGRLISDVRYEPHEDGSLPASIRIEQPFQALVVTLEVQDGRAADLKDSAFRFEIPAGREVIDIASDDAQLPSGLPGVDDPTSVDDGTGGPLR